MQCQIFGELGPAAPPSAAAGDLSNRTATAAAVLWDVPPSASAGEDGELRTPDISELVHEIVNEPSWASGSGMGLLFAHASGAGMRRVSAAHRDLQSGTLTPALHIGFVSPEDGSAFAHWVVRGEPLQLKERLPQELYCPCHALARKASANRSVALPPIPPVSAQCAHADCRGTWTCSKGCARIWLEERPQSGNGLPCPVMPGECQPGEGDCPRDCAGYFEPCTAACEATRAWVETAAPSGGGAECPSSADVLPCVPGEGECKGDYDCLGFWLPCTERCEVSFERVWVETMPQGGTGQPCPNATSCRPAEGACPPSIPCVGGFSPCTSACEVSNERSWIQTVPNTGLGAACPAPYRSPSAYARPEDRETRHQTVRCDTMDTHHYQVYPDSDLAGLELSNSSCYVATELGERWGAEGASLYYTDVAECIDVCDAEPTCLGFVDTTGQRPHCSFKRISSDPCEALGGILGTDANADTCCAASCGSCGGSSCELNEGGAASCCADLVREAGVACADSGVPPCLLSIPSEWRPYDPPISLLNTSTSATVRNYHHKLVERAPAGEYDYHGSVSALRNCQCEPQFNVSICPAGYEPVGSEEQCEAAAVHLDIGFDGSQGSVATPGGCHVDVASNVASWNPSTGSAVNEAMQLLCLATNGGTEASGWRAYDLLGRGVCEPGTSASYIETARYGCSPGSCTAEEQSRVCFAICDASPGCAAVQAQSGSGSCVAYTAQPVPHSLNDAPGDPPQLSNGACGSTLSVGVGGGGSAAQPGAVTVRHGQTFGIQHSEENGPGGHLTNCHWVLDCPENDATVSFTWFSTEGGWDYVNLFSAGSAHTASREAGSSGSAGDLGHFAGFLPDLEDVYGVALVQYITDGSVLSSPSGFSATLTCGSGSGAQSTGVHPRNSLQRWCYRRREQEGGGTCVSGEGGCP